VKDNFAREADYRRQNNGAPLTAKQQKRLRLRAHRPENKKWSRSLR
jgi:hypothetical protein